MRIDNPILGSPVSGDFTAGDFVWPAVLINTPTVTKTSTSVFNATATFNIQIILCDTSANNVTINLPTAVGNTAIYHIKKTSSNNLLVLDPTGAETIDGSATVTVSVQYETLTLVSDNINWSVI